MSNISALTPEELNHTATPTPTTTGDALYTPYLTLVLPDTTVVSALSPRPTPPRPPSNGPPVSVEEENEFRKHDSAAAQINDAGGMAGQRIDLERLKFRLVFILWPALVGITMAL